MRWLPSSLLLSAVLAVAPAFAAVTTTADLVAVSPGVPGTWTFTSGGWAGGGTVTGSFGGTDANTDGQLSSFDGEVTAFAMSYSGGAIVGPFGLGFAALFGLVYDLNGGPLGDGVALDIEGIGATGSGISFTIGPGPVAVCGTGAVCGTITGPAAAIPEPAALALALAGIGLLAAARRRRAR
jgi:MYXO-CTERM domain-containing protein